MILSGSSAPSKIFSSDRPSMWPGMSSPAISSIVGAKSMFSAMFGTLQVDNNEKLPYAVADPGFLVGWRGPVGGGGAWTSYLGAFWQKCVQK